MSSDDGEARWAQILAPVDGRLRRVAYKLIKRIGQGAEGEVYLYVPLNSRGVQRGPTSSERKLVRSLH